MNIYYPPNHPVEFISKAFADFPEIECEQSLIGGDFNCLLDPQLENVRQRATLQPKDKGSDRAL